MEAIRKTENFEPCRGMISPSFCYVSVSGILAHQYMVVIVTNTIHFAPIFFSLTTFLFLLDRVARFSEGLPSALFHCCNS